MRYKNLFCLVLTLIGIVNVSYSQLYIGPSLGLNQHYVISGENSIGFQVVNPFSPTSSIGIKTELTLTNSLFLSMSNTYTSKKLEAGDRGLAPLNGIKYQSINTYLALNKTIFSTVSIGAGVNYIFTPKINWLYNTLEPLTAFQNRSDIGGGLSMSYAYKKFVFDINYGYSFTEWNKDEVKDLILPISILQIHFSYLIKTNIIKSKNTRR